MISLNAIGKDTRHTGDFCIWRPDGSGDNLLVIFKTSALLIIDGNEIIVPPDSLIIYKKDTPQYYKTICGNYANHFIHFNVTDDDNILDTVETDRLITSVNISAVEELLTILCRENMSPSEHRRQYADMLSRGVIDPAAVVITALRSAVSVGAQLLTADAAVLIDGAPISSIPVPDDLHITPQDFM